MARAHYPLVDLFRLERGYPKEVGPNEADDLRVGLLDLSSTVIGDINLYGTSTLPISQDQTGRPGSFRGVDCRSGRSTPAVSTSQALVAPTPLAGQDTRAGEQPEQ